MKKKLALLTYFSLWKSVRKTRAQAYDCEVCQQYQYFENRHCFHPLYGEEKILLPIHQFDEEFVDPQVGLQYREDVEPKEEKLTGDDLIDELSRISLLIPDAPIFKLLGAHYQYPTEVCVTGLLGPMFNDIYLWEERSEKYGVFPFTGGQLDQPIAMLEAFDIIRSATSQFNRDRMIEVEDEAKRGK